MTCTEVTKSDAESLTLRITMLFESTTNSMLKLRERIAEAYGQRIWVPLGYESWEALCHERFGDAAEKLSSAYRGELAGALMLDGLSIRAVASAVGVSKSTVSRIVKRDQVKEVSHDGTRAVVEEAGVPVSSADAADTETEARAADDVSAEKVSKHLTGPQKVTGVDGKQYTRPAPAEPRRSSIVDDVRKRAWKAAQQIERLSTLLANDDRVARNAEAIATVINEVEHAYERLVNVEHRYMERGR